MILEEKNFVINMLLINNGNIKKYDITEKISRFTSTNSSPTLGTEKIKYKIMFENLEIPDDITNYNNLFILFQISLKKDNKYYNPYLFHPINYKDNKNYLEGPGRALSFRIFKNNFNYIWIYLTHSSVNSILENFTLEENITNKDMYIKEYLPNYATI